MENKNKQKTEKQAKIYPVHDMDTYTMCENT